MKWRDCLVGDLMSNGSAEVQTGPFGTQLKASDYVADGTPVINVRNVGYADLRAEKLEYVADHTADRLRVHLLKENDIVFGRKGAVDRHLFVTKDQENWMQGSDCIRLRFSGTEVYPRFVSYAFLQEAHQQWMISQSGNKATMASLNQDIIGRIALRLPLRTVQEAIVNILSAYDEQTANNRRRMGLLEKAARLLYQEWFVRLRFPGHEHIRVSVGVPQGWAKKKIQEMVALTIGGGWGGDEHDSKFTEPAFVIRGTDIPDIKDGNFATIPNRFHVPSNLASRLLQPGDIILEISNGNIRNIGRSLRVEPSVLQIFNGEVICASFCRLLRPAGVSESQLLTSHLEEIQANGRMDFFKTPSAAGINNFRFTGLLEDESILVPPRALLGEFVSQISSIRIQLANLAVMNQKLRAARDLLLPRMMSGEIDV